MFIFFLPSKISSPSLLTQLEILPQKINKNLVETPPPKKPRKQNRPPPKKKRGKEKEKKKPIYKQMKIHRKDEEFIIYWSTNHML